MMDQALELLLRGKAELHNFQQPAMYMNLIRGFLEQGRISSGTTSRRVPYAIQDLLLHSKRTCGQSLSESVLQENYICLTITTGVSRWGS
ncbi:hypothetical protein Bca52824_070992 [Brassica carinata]|uniref:Uncharacterized protein n=1 Tax=Brassica carinata TaxID=52824 RepID=A0A8X7Q991_BRACI|nr:hypothetical protein Bca52824_070992 [Brassica carinata]